MVLRYLLLFPLLLWRAQSPAQDAVEIVYDTVNRNPAVVFYYPEPANHNYLRKLKQQYALDTLTRPGKTETILAVLAWTHRQWQHNGENEPSKPDALTILKEAKEGRKFRCVEYATVLTDALLSLGYKARVVALKTKDVETAASGAGHVLSEVWLPGFQKWALIDGQFNLMPVLNNIPLNAVELQQAILNRKPFKFIDTNGEVSAGRGVYYLFFIKKYLYYFDTKIDSRPVASPTQPKYGGKTHLMLVPLQVKKPEVFQQQYPIDYAHYTNALKDFYQPPY